MNAPAPNLQAKRRSIEQKIDRLRAERGSALLDSRTFDDAKLVEAERELVAIDDAVAEQQRRASVKDDTVGRAARVASIAALKKQTARRVAAAAALQPAALALAERIREFADAGAECQRLTGLFGLDEAALSPQNLGNRAGGYLRTALRGLLKVSHLGALPLAAQPGDIEPGADYAAHEACLGDVVATIEWRDQEAA